MGVFLLLFVLFQGILPLVTLDDHLVCPLGLLASLAPPHLPESLLFSVGKFDGVSPLRDPVKWPRRSLSVQFTFCHTAQEALSHSLTYTGPFCLTACDGPMTWGFPSRSCRRLALGGLQMLFSPRVLHTRFSSGCLSQRPPQPHGTLRAVSLLCRPGPSGRQCWGTICVYATCT